MKEQVIDFVIPWIDGNDSVWFAEKAKYLEEFTQKTGDTWNIDAGINRYRDWGNLRYWFRAVEKYAPWVNRIHLIVWNEAPEWLDTENPKIHVVRHADYIPTECLPTFSSHPIELNMHRIPGLAEQFVYFNDDCFLTAPVKPTDFFVNGLPCDSVSESPNSCDPGIFRYICTNNIVCINRHFSRAEVRKKYLTKWFTPMCMRDSIRNFVFAMGNIRNFFGFAGHHQPQPYLKSTFEEMWELEPELLYETSRHRFRDARDVNQYVFRFYQLLSGRFHPYSICSHAKFYGGSIDVDDNKLVNDILSQRYQRICINDDKQVDFELVKERVNTAFARMLPDKCSFER